MKYSEIYKTYCIEEVALYYPKALTHLIKQNGALEKSNYNPEKVVDIYAKSTKIIIPNNPRNNKRIEIKYLKDGTLKYFKTVPITENNLPSKAKRQGHINLRSIEIKNEVSRINFIRSFCRELFKCSPKALTNQRLVSFWESPNNFISSVNDLLNESDLPSLHPLDIMPNFTLKSIEATSKQKESEEDYLTEYLTEEEKKRRRENGLDNPKYIELSNPHNGFIERQFHLFSEDNSFSPYQEVFRQWLS